MSINQRSHSTLFLFSILLPLYVAGQIKTYYPYNLDVDSETKQMIELKDKVSLGNSNILTAQNNDVFQNMMKDENNILRVLLPLDSKKTITLELFEHRVLGKDFRIVDSKNQEVDLPSFRTFKGTVLNSPESKVSLTLLNDQLKGIVHFENQTYILGKLTTGEQHLFYNGADVSIPNTLFPVSDELSPPLELEKHKPVTIPGTSAVGCKILRVYFEIDYSLYTTWGSNTSAVTSNFMALMNIVTSTFAAEQIEVVAGGIKLWDSPDPYHNATLDMNISLESFRVAMNAMSPAYNGDIAHLLSTELVGGLAYVGILNSPAYAVGLTGYIDNYATNSPLYGWNAEALCHELGHNMGSQHTQSCTWPGGPIDNCVSPEWNCSPGPPPIAGGTIMSYCQFIGTPYTTMLANGFGPLPGDKIRQGIADANNLQISPPPPNPVITGNDTICFPDDLTITAHCSVGIPQWFSDAAGTVLLLNGSTYNTGVLTANKTIYVACNQDLCSSALVSVNFTGSNVIPSPPLSKTSYFCSKKSYTLTADGCSAGTIMWYYSASGGSPFKTGNPLVINKPPFSKLDSKNYYASCKVGGCESERTLQRAARVIIIAPPYVEYQTIQSGNTASLNALNCNYTTKWYSDASTTSLLHTGNNYLTPALTSNTTYYLRCEANDACTSSVSQAVVVVLNCQNSYVFSNPTDNINSGIHHPESYNQIESNAVISGGNVKYDASTFIDLNPGFSAANGAVFKAYIDGCGGD